jgi:hypothetical protein
MPIWKVSGVYTATQGVAFVLNNWLLQQLEHSAYDKVASVSCNSCELGQLQQPSLNLFFFI